MNKKYCIIFSEPDDWSTNDVMDWITFFNRIPLRINANKILNAEFCFDFHSPSNCFVFLTKKISFKEISSLWYRRTMQIDLSYYKSNLSLNEELTKAISQHKFDELKYARDAFYRLTTNHKWLNNPFNSIIDKSLCLIQARKNKLLVPSTIITTSKKEAIDFFNRNNKNLIIKPIYNVSMLKYQKKNYLQYTTV